MNKLIDSGDRPSFDVPVLFILYNRPQHARRVLDRFRLIQPTQLFVAIDGPQAGVDKDAEKVQQCRALLDEIDWPCTITKLTHERNLGCKLAVSQAIDWFFGQVEAGIILEDDCLPDLTFFDYCRVLLKKYADELSIMHISGCNLYGGRTWGKDSCFFTTIPHIWGWATWRRAWAYYDVNMLGYPDFKRSGGLERTIPNVDSQGFWKKTLNEVYTGRVDTWDYQWVYTIWRYGGFCVTPNQNLISNIGFDQAATHTRMDSELANLPTTPLNIDTVSLPTHVELNKDALDYAFSHFYQLHSWWSTKLSALRRLAATKLFD